MFDALARMGALSEEEMTSGQDQKIYGVALAQVISNIDLKSLGRVQLLLPWLPGYQPWARVAVLAAGMGSGTYFIPQIGDEVLVAFNQGDIREPYVIGCLWNSTDRPPALATTDPLTKRKIRTLTGNEIAIDETTQSITITNSTQQTVTIDPLQIKVSNTTGTASLTITTAGTVSIEASTSLELKSAKISIKAGTLDLTGAGNATLKAGGNCTIQGALVKIN